MPTDPSTAPATTTSRRSFLTRTAVGGALVTAGALTGSATGLIPSVPALADDAPYTDAQVANFLAPLELSAVITYQTALDSGVLDATWQANVSTIQAHHNTAATTLIAMLPSTATAPLAADAFGTAPSKALTEAKTQDAVLSVLSKLEQTLADTHLRTLGNIPDPVTAKVIAQVLAAEAQQAAYLGQAAGTALAALTPRAASTSDGLAPGDVAGAPATTTTTAAGN